MTVISGSSTSSRRATRSGDRSQISEELDDRAVDQVRVFPGSSVSGPRNLDVARSPDGGGDLPRESGGDQDVELESDDQGGHTDGGERAEANLAALQCAPPRTRR